MLNESDLRRILFLKNLTDIDSKSELGWRAINQQIASSIRKRAETPASFFTEWTTALQKRLEERHRFDLSLHFKKHKLSPLAYLGIGFFIFLLGLGSNYFGSGNKINLWLNPFTGFLFWNFGIFLFLGLNALLGLTNRQPTTLGLDASKKLVSIIITKLSRHMPAYVPFEKVPEVLTRVQVAFRRDWFQHFGKIPMARLSRALHLLAVIFTVGIIAGMYFRGFASNYEFTWDSTFVSDEARSFWTNLVFGPVLWIAKPFIPGGLPQFEPNNGSDWIHIFTAAAVLYIVIPRFILAILVHFRAQKMRQNITLPFKDQVWQSLYAEADATPLPLHLLLYSYSFDQSRIDQLLSKLKKALPGNFNKGDQIEITWGEIEVENLREDTSGAWMIVFNGAQTPEEDVHGEFCQNLLQTITPDSDGSLLFLVDSSRVPAERTGQRRQNWDRIFQKHGIQSWAWLPFGDDDFHTVPLSIRDHIIRFAS